MVVISWKWCKMGICYCRPRTGRIHLLSNCTIFPMTFSDFQVNTPTARFL